MISIQKKILTLTTVVIGIMSIIYIALTFYNYKTQVKYDEILNRYLILNEVSRASNQLISDSNNYLKQPSLIYLEKLNNSSKMLEASKYGVFKVRTKENDFMLTNYTNLIDSLIETTNRLVSVDRDSDKIKNDLIELTRIGTYISETTLSLIDMELKTQEPIYRGIMEQAAKLVKLAIWMMLLTALVLVLASYWFSLNITKSIQQLTKSVSELSKGKFDNKITVQSNDEISFLAKTFDLMRTNINNLIQQIKDKARLEHELQENKLLLQESQYRSLQNQINPHFLYNTLNTLSKKAYLEGSEEISDLLVSVADLLRYNLKQIERDVTIRDEIVVITKYMEIQKARFTDRLQLKLHIDEESLDFPIPAFTLQPIVENAIIHAVEPRIDGGTITIRVLDGCDFITIEIEDDGVGMPEEKVQQILSEQEVETDGHSTGIGFNNVVKRLRLFYEMEGLISIKSELQKGTIIQLKIPKQRGQ